MSKNLIGRKFGRLTVVEADGKTASRHTKWLCQCECGKTKSVVSRDLLNGHTQSCGCLQREKVTKQGYRKIGNTERLYNVWHGIILRCTTPTTTGYKYYGGRGITVCDEWKEYSAFREWALANGYDETLPKGECTIDRIDVNGNYEPNNCRWVDSKVQAMNKRYKDGEQNERTD